MRIICILVAAVLALTFAGAAYADCGCSKHEGCGCAKHNKCSGDIQLLPDAPQDCADLPQCCDQAQYTICCGHEDYKLLCHDEPCKCKAKKCNDCGCSKCSSKGCSKCGRKSCNKCNHKSSGCDDCD